MTTAGTVTIGREDLRVLAACAEASLATNVIHTPALVAKVAVAVDHAKTALQSQECP